MLLQMQVPDTARHAVPRMGVASADKPVIRLSSFFGEHHCGTLPHCLLAISTPAVKPTGS